VAANVTLITLGVSDVKRATRFYESLGFVKSQAASQESVSFFRAGGVVLALWGREAQIEDANAGHYGTAMVESRLRKISQARPRSMRYWQKPKPQGHVC
jgi:catechol-2,3-dioxygenase